METATWLIEEKLITKKKLWQNIGSFIINVMVDFFFANLSFAVYLEKPQS